MGVGTRDATCLGKPSIGRSLLWQLEQEHDIAPDAALTNGVAGAWIAHVDRQLSQQAQHDVANFGIG